MDKCNVLKNVEKIHLTLSIRLDAPPKLQIILLRNFLLSYFLQDERQLNPTCQNIG